MGVCFVVPVVCNVLFPKCLFMVFYFFVYVCVLLCYTWVFRVLLFCYAVLSCFLCVLAVVCVRGVFFL